MNGSIRLGPLALIFTVITMCLAVLAILTFTTARADLRVAEKYARTVQENYELEAQGQTFLQTAAAQQPDEDGVIRTQLQRDNTTLDIAVRAEEDGTLTVLEWRLQRQWEQDTSMGGLWTGTFGGTE